MGTVSRRGAARHPAHGLTVIISTEDPDAAAKLLRATMHATQANCAMSEEHVAVVLTAIEPEYQAVRAYLSYPVSTVDARGTLFEVGTFQGHTVRWTVAVTQTGQGGGSAAAHLERAVATFAPSIALFCGTAGGLRDVRLGDVVAADDVYDYSSAKDVASTTLPRIKTRPSAYRLVQRAQYVSREGRWRARIAPPYEGGRAPRSFVKPIAAGGRIVADARSRTAKLLATQCGDALAVETEGYGFLVDAHLNRGVDALVICGISDLLADKEPTSDAIWQPVAASHAAAFAFEILDGLGPRL
jgi:nucleoside phosphorylase